MLFCHLWLVWLYHTFPHRLRNGTIVGKKVIAYKMCVLIASQLLSDIVHIIRILQVHRSSCRVPVILVRLHWYSKFLDRFYKNSQRWNFMKIRPMGAELSHADGQTDMTKVIVAFRNLANVPKTCVTNSLTLLWYVAQFIIYKETHLDSSYFPKCSYTTSVFKYWCNL